MTLRWTIRDQLPSGQWGPEREVTLALIQYKTPLAAVTFPRFINTTTDMQAAAPAVEITRLLSMVGVGTDVLRALAGVLLLTSSIDAPCRDVKQLSVCTPDWAALCCREY